MRSTLFYLPHQFAGLPLFGFGWALIAIVLWGIVWSIWQSKRNNQKGIADSLPAWGIAAILVVFLFPRMETQISDEDWLGVPVRGYGLMLMLGVLSATAMAASRCKKIGISFDDLMSLAIHMCIGGISGARLFFVVQKWSELPGESNLEKLYAALKFTEGGLVVYGGVIGGLIACAYWSRKKKIALLPVADLVTPGFLIGLCLGRIGCLLHGCCFGGICYQENIPAIQFPSGSEPYLAQAVRGELLGLTLSGSEDEGRIIEKVEANSWAHKQGLKVGQRIDMIKPTTYWPEKGLDPAGPQKVSVALIVDGKEWKGARASLPNRSLPLHPAQIYSSVNALLIGGLLFFAWPAFKRDGYLLALALVLYAISRWIEEIIRADELGILGTPFTVSQWVSILGFIIAGAILAVQISKPPKRAFVGI